MKVICAGFNKTGTKSMYGALHILGYTTYDFMENATFLADEWIKIFESGWTTEDFQKMYSDVDAVTDYPASYFWREIHEAFPDSKIVLMIREDEEAWCDSMVKQLRVLEGSFMLRLMKYMSPTARRTTARVYPYMASVVLGHSDEFVWKPFSKARINRELLKMKYRAHNSSVLQSAPPEKLLVYKFSDGWGPLCKFLEVPVPDVPFPHKNKGAEILQEILEQNPYMIKMKKEVVTSLAIITLITSLTGYFIVKHGPKKIFNVICNKLETFVKKD